jgi:hypothetical protein
MTHTRKLLGAKVCLTFVAVAGLTAGFAAPAGAAAAPTMDTSLIDKAQVEVIARLVGEQRQTFAGASIDEAAGVLTVQYDRDAGLPSAKSKLSEANPAGAAVRGAKIKLVLTPVQHSHEELDAVRAKMRSDKAWSLAAKNVIVQDNVDLKRNIVAIGVTAITPELTAQAARTFGDLAYLYVTHRLDRAVSRDLDTPPLKVGARIWSATSGCSSGFVIRNLTTQEKRMVTAGHCGPLGTAWTTGTGAAVGTTVARTFGPGLLDVSYIGGGSYLSWMWVGTPTSGVGVAVGGYYTSLVGRKLCTDGATSGEVCTGTVTAIEICHTFSDGIETCRLDDMTSDGTFTMTRPGDSGGPVITPPGLDQVAGIIIGGGGTRTLFHWYANVVPAGWVAHPYP